MLKFHFARVQSAISGPKGFSPSPLCRSHATNPSGSAGRVVRSQGCGIPSGGKFRQPCSVFRNASLSFETLCSSSSSLCPMISDQSNDHQASGSLPKRSTRSFRVSGEIACSTRVLPRFSQLCGSRRYPQTRTSRFFCCFSPLLRVETNETAKYCSQDLPSGKHSQQIARDVQDGQCLSR